MKRTDTGAGTNRLLYKLGKVLPTFLDELVPDAKGRCILATALAVEVLRRRGIPAEPMSVELKLANTAYVEWMDAGQPGGAAEAVARGARILLTGDDEDPVTGTRVGKDWHGHLVVHLPKTQRVPARLVDFDLKPTRRPAHLLWPPEWAVIDLGELSTGFVFFPTGVAFYKLKPADRSWETAGDWVKRDGYGAAIAVLLQLIR